MMDRPEVRYAVAADGAHIAYQTFGVGRHDILVIPGQITHLDLQWDEPEFARWYRAIAELGRVILMDRRGVGLSDRFSPHDLPTAEILSEDLGAVLDAASSPRAVVFGFAEGGQIASLFSAIHPERVEGLILYATWTHVPEEIRPGWEEYMDRAPTTWGSPEVSIWDAREVQPGRANEPAYVDWISRIQRAALSPGAVRALFKVGIDLDVRDVMPSIEVPTLVMHREHDSAWPVEYLSAPARSIPGAELVVLPGIDHWFTAEPQEPMVDAISSFVRSLDGVPSTPTRRLATVMFTDIVGSTERSSNLGDEAWRALLETHHAVVRSELARSGGREISTAGDGFFASFDGPAAAARCGVALVDAVRAHGLEIRVGVHTGEVETIDGEIGGIGVTIGARIGALAGASEVLVSSTVKDLVAGSGLRLEDAGEHELKGVPDRWHVYRVI